MLKNAILQFPFPAPWGLISCLVSVLRESFTLTLYITNRVEPLERSLSYIFSVQNILTLSVVRQIIIIIYSSNKG